MSAAHLGRGKEEKLKRLGYPPSMIGTAFALLFFILASSACDAERKAWKKASTLDTIASYQEYLEAYPMPSGKNAPEAQIRLHELKVTAVLSSDDISALESQLHHLNYDYRDLRDRLGPAFKEKIASLYLKERLHEFRDVKKAALKIAKIGPLPDDFHIQAGEWLRLAGIEIVGDDDGQADAIMTVTVEGRAISHRYLTHLQTLLMNSQTFRPIRPSGTLYFSGASLQGGIRLETRSGHLFGEDVPIVTLRPPESVSVVMSGKDPREKPQGAPFREVYLAEYHVGSGTVSFNTKLALAVRRVFGLAVVARALKTDCHEDLKAGAAHAFVLEGESAVPYLLALADHPSSDVGIIAWVLGRLRDPRGRPVLEALTKNQSLFNECRYLLPDETFPEAPRIGEIARWALSKLEEKTL